MALHTISNYIISFQKNDHNIVAERGQVVRIMPPEIDE